MNESFGYCEKLNAQCNQHNIAFEDEETLSPRRRTPGSGCGAGRLRRRCWWRVSLPACRRCTWRQGNKHRSSNCGALMSGATQWPVSGWSVICDYRVRARFPHLYGSTKQQQIKQRAEKPERRAWNDQKHGLRLDKRNNARGQALQSTVHRLVMKQHCLYCWSRSAETHRHSNYCASTAHVIT